MLSTFSCDPDLLQVLSFAWTCAALPPPSSLRACEESSDWMSPSTGFCATLVSSLSLVPAVAVTFTPPSAFPSTCAGQSSPFTRLEADWSSAASLAAMSSPSSSSESLSLLRLMSPAPASAMTVLSSAVASAFSTRLSPSFFRPPSCHKLPWLSAPPVFFSSPTLLPAASAPGLTASFPTSAFPFLWVSVLSDGRPTPEPARERDALSLSA